MAAISLPAPVALARLVDTFTPVGVREPRWEPKWDGYRALACNGRLWSRNGTDLTRLFPDLAPVLAARLPADLVLDGQLVAWDTAAGRLDFDSLQRRMTAGRRINAVAARRPAQYVAFDVLADGACDVRDEPLTKRRRRLERTLGGVSAPIVVCQQTDDAGTAEEWFDTLSAGGIEGVVVKDAAGVYPRRDGQRVWFKRKVRRTVDMIAVGVTGLVEAPTAVVLAFPGHLDDNGVHVTAGATGVLTREVARRVGSLIRPTGATFVRAFAWGAAPQTQVSVIEPLVVEVAADAAVDAGFSGTPHACFAFAPKSVSTR